MLGNAEVLRVETSGISVGHDYWTMSLSAGEPFLEDGVLAYDDGRLVTIWAFPLRGDFYPTRASLQAMCTRWIVARGAEAICIVSPHPVGTAFLRGHGFRRTYWQYRTVSSAELFLDCSEGQGSAFHLSAYRRARFLGFEAVVRCGGIVPADYFKLIEHFYDVAGVNCYLADLAFTLPAILRSSRAHIIEARSGETLSGFVVLHKPFRDVAVALFLAHDHSSRGVSDFLYSKMIEHARSLGARSINVGPSPSIGHHRFKRKWGGRPGIPPFHLEEWARGIMARRVHTSWGPRLVRLQWQDR